MVGITVAVAATLVLMMTFTEHVPGDQTRASLTGSLDPGGDEAWGTGDEAALLRHTGGSAVHQASMAVIVHVGDSSHRFNDQEGTLAHGDQDVFGPGEDRFSLGERWRSPAVTIPAGAPVVVDVIAGPGQSTVIWSGTVTAPTGGSP